MRNEEQKLEAQHVLDGLLEGGLIPFKLNVGSMLQHGFSQYRARFNDSRIQSVDFDWLEGESFAEIFRTAVLDRVEGMRGRLPTKAHLKSH